MAYSTMAIYIIPVLWEHQCQLYNINLGTVVQEKSTRKKLCHLLVCILHANLNCVLTAI